VCRSSPGRYANAAVFNMAVVVVCSFQRRASSARNHDVRLQLLLREEVHASHDAKANRIDRQSDSCQPARRGRRTIHIRGSHQHSDTAAQQRSSRLHCAGSPWNDDMRAGWRRTRSESLRMDPPHHPVRNRAGHRSSRCGCRGAGRTGGVSGPNRLSIVGCSSLDTAIKWLVGVVISALRNATGTTAARLKSGATN